MSLYSEYIEKKKQGKLDYVTELTKLINQYYQMTGIYLFVYVSASYKPNVPIALEQSDFYVLYDLLRNVKEKNIDFYLETPGGNGHTAEDIARFLHKKFQRIAFIISGEAKSAGTILALSGHEIYLTNTGSLGPIDAQIPYHRGRYSAHDYIEWLKEKMDEAKKEGSLNPVDAQIISQINPGEVKQVYNALQFAYDVVRKWLVKYKFSNWDKTETRKKAVTVHMKKMRANSIAKQLCNHTRWRNHGRSIKIDDLKSIGLKVISLDKNTDVVELVYRIQTICKLLCDTSSVFKIMATKDNKILRHQIAVGSIEKGEHGKRKAESVTVDVVCPKCKAKHTIKALLIDGKDKEAEKENHVVSFPKDNVLKCHCGAAIDLTSLKNEIESQTGSNIK